MALTTHEKIRVESGFQSYFTREAFQNLPNGINSVFFVNSDDNVKFVPNFNTGATIAGVSDVAVYLGLSGIYGVSRLNVTAIDIEQGSVQLPMVLPTGASLTINYASSPIPYYQVEQMRRQAESIINNRLGLCYTLPWTYTSSQITSMASRLAAAMLLIRNYGTGSRDTASDGYRLYDLLMGNQDTLLNEGTDTEMTRAGEIGLICTPNFQLIDDDGVIIPRNDSGTVGNGGIFTPGGRVRGRLYDISEEAFRFKDWQDDTMNRDQPGSGL